jgi:enoyl-CoA hydratase
LFRWKDDARAKKALITVTQFDLVSDSDLIRAWREGPAAYVRLNRPEKANAYNQAMLEALETFVRRISAAPEVRVVVIAGAGDRAFCAGADLTEVGERDWRSAVNLRSAEVFFQISRCPKVTLAAVNGAAVGGGLELALACDLRIAADNASFSFPEPQLGLIPAAGGTQRLAQVVGKARAKELILGGQVWQAKEALRFGLLSEVTEREELLPKARQWVERIASRNPVALQLAKTAIDLDSLCSPGYSFESVAEALLYQLRLEGNTSNEPLLRGRDREN